MGPDLRVSEKHKFVFVTTPKCGSQTLFQVLDQYYGPVIAMGQHTSVVPPKYRKYYIWTVVRNPYTRAISQWWHSVGSGSRRRSGAPHLPALDPDTTFPEYVEWLTNPLRPTTGPGPGWNHAENQGERFKHFKADQVLRFEELEDQFFSLPFTEVGRPPWMPKVNSANWHSLLGGKEPPRRGSLYTQELADKVYYWEKAVFNDYGYCRGSWGAL